MMKGKIISYRRGRNTQRNDQMLVRIEGVEDKDSATKLIGKKVVWKSKKAVIQGQVSAPHGAKGVVRVSFDKGMPGQAVTTEVDIQ
jgi:large subunit ribosomal protein L35Ae